MLSHPRVAKAAIPVHQRNAAQHNQIAKQGRFQTVKRGWHRQLVAGVATQQEVSQPGAVIGAPTD